MGRLLSRRIQKSHGKNTQERLLAELQVAEATALNGGSLSLKMELERGQQELHSEVAEHATARMISSTLETQLRADLEAKSKELEGVAGDASEGRMQLESAAKKERVLRVE